MRSWAHLLVLDDAVMSAIDSGRRWRCPSCHSSSSRRGPAHQADQAGPGRGRCPPPVTRRLKLSCANRGSSGITEHGPVDRVGEVALEDAARGAGIDDVPGCRPAPSGGPGRRAGGNCRGRAARCAWSSPRPGCRRCDDGDPAVTGSAVSGCPQAGMLLQVDGSRHDGSSAAGSGHARGRHRRCHPARHRRHLPRPGGHRGHPRGAHPTARAYGMPLRFYSDRHGVVLEGPRLGCPPSRSSSPGWARRPSWAGALEAAIAWVAARSARAQGRVERLWGTAQDRLLVKAAPGRSDDAGGGGPRPRGLGRPTQRPLRGRSCLPLARLLPLPGGLEPDEHILRRVCRVPAPDRPPGSGCERRRARYSHPKSRPPPIVPRPTIPGRRHAAARNR